LTAHQLIYILTCFDLSFNRPAFADRSYHHHHVLLSRNHRRHHWPQGPYRLLLHRHQEDHASEHAQGQEVDERHVLGRLEEDGGRRSPHPEQGLLQARCQGQEGPEEEGNRTKEGGT